MTSISACAAAPSAHFTRLPSAAHRPTSYQKSPLAEHRRLLRVLGVAADYAHFTRSVAHPVRCPPSDLFPEITPGRLLGDLRAAACYAQSTRIPSPDRRPTPFRKSPQEGSSEISAPLHTTPSPRASRSPTPYQKSPLPEHPRWRVMVEDSDPLTLDQKVPRIARVMKIFTNQERYVLLQRHYLETN